VRPGAKSSRQSKLCVFLAPLAEGLFVDALKKVAADQQLKRQEHDVRAMPPLLDALVQLPKKISDQRYFDLAPCIPSNNRGTQESQGLCKQF